MFEVNIGDSFGWILILPALTYTFMIGLGLYISILIIKALKLYIKNNS